MITPKHAKPLLVFHNTGLTDGKQPGQSGGDRNRQFPQHVIDPEKGLVVVRLGKKLSFAELREYAELLRANPAFQPSFSEIADLTEVEEVDLNAGDFLKLADEIDPFSVDAKRAFVARTSTQNHAARMHKMLRGERRFEIFSTLEEAEQWIRG
jgi:hypothetical protein